MAEAVGIKESLELLDGLKILAIDVKKVFADGKVSIADLPVAMELLGQLGTLTAAIQGVDQILVEAKDLSAEEINALVAKVFEVVAAYKAA